MRLMKRACALILSAAMISSLNYAPQTDAAKKPKLNKKSYKVMAGKNVTVKVMNGSKKAKVSWKLSKKKVAKIVKQSKKGSKAFAKIKAIKPGTTRITATYKLGKSKKVLKSKITVNKVLNDNTVTTPAPPTAGSVTPTPSSIISPIASEMPTAVPTPTVPPSEKMQLVLDNITIPYSDGVRGNITLPESVDGAAVTWKSSNTAVITDQKIGEKAAGVVTRGAEDQIIKLTATVSKDSEVAYKEIEVNVLKAPEKLTDDDFTGYLFGSFTGTEYNTDCEQIYFAASEDGYNYEDLNNGRPVLVSDIGEKGVRDPYICRSAEGDRFFLIATDLSIFLRGGWYNNNANNSTVTGSHSLIFWESTDLVNWENARQIEVAADDAGMAWAPEMIYNDKTGEYVIFFASTVLDDERNTIIKPPAIYCVKTRDFVNFSETELFIDNEDGRDIIDTTMLKAEDGYYYRASKDGGNDDVNGGIRLDRSTDIFGEWEKVMDLDELGFDRDMTNRTLEGPELFRFNKRDWKDADTPTYGVLADRYMEGSGYFPVTTTNLLDIGNADGSWEIPTGRNYSFGTLSKRHGTVINITQDELSNLLYEYNDGNGL